MGNAHSPMTDLANEFLLSVASPRSPILTEPVGPVMKMLSHFRSRWMTGGERVCRKCRRTLVPPRMFCDWCYGPTDEWVELPDTGIVETFSIAYLDADARRIKDGGYNLK